MDRAEFEVRKSDIPCKKCGQLGNFIIFENPIHAGGGVRCECGHFLRWLKKPSSSLPVIGGGIRPEGNASEYDGPANLLNVMLFVTNAVRAILPAGRIRIRVEAIRP